MAIGLDSAQDIRTGRQAEEAAVGVQAQFAQVREGQSLVIRYGGAEVGARPALNLIAGTNITLSVVDDPIENEVEITVTLAASPDVAAAYRVAGNDVVKARGAAIPDAAGGATVDTEARAAINALLAHFRTWGAIAP